LIEHYARIAVVGAASEAGEVAEDLLAVDADPVSLACRLPKSGPIAIVDDSVGCEAQPISG
jgi:hypothetical protein